MILPTGGNRPASPRRRCSGRGTSRSCPRVCASRGATDTKACTPMRACAASADARAVPAATDGIATVPGGGPQAGPPPNVLSGFVVAPDAPLLERLAQLPAVSVSELVECLERMPNVARDPLLAGLVGVDEAGDPAMHPLVGTVV